MIITVVQIENTCGETAEECVSDTENNIVVGIKDNNGVYRQFDGRAYYLPSWAEKHGLKFKMWQIHVNLVRDQASATVLSR